MVELVALPPERLDHEAAERADNFAQLGLPGNTGEKGRRSGVALWTWAWAWAERQRTWRLDMITKDLPSNRRAGPSAIDD
jgi:hypothetical protein